MDKLKFIKEQMAALEIPYEYGAWTSAVKSRYYVGELTEEPTTSEDGFEQSTMILDGFNRGQHIDLERDKNKIKKHFHPIYGLRARTDSGSIAVFFDGSFPVPTNEADLKRIEIHLNIQEWKGDL